jgi:hypothetical protein
MGATGGVVSHHWREGGPPWTRNVSARFGNDAAVCPTLTGTTYNRNMEIVYTTTGHRLHHWWRQGGGGAWNDGGVFGPTDYHGGPGFVQGDYGAPGNFEVVVAVGGHIQHWWRDNASGSMTWRQSATFGHDVLAVAGLTERSWGMNLELIVLRTDGQLQHYWRDDAGWHEGPHHRPA